ncbi:MAG TPA: hypothetical protein VEZ17_15335 [Chitinophagaceae bacterium]|jgi:hypothetical protein|nr:hypothetical protein [Chitinophagaceae bacterium]
MDELIERLKQEAGLTTEQAGQAIEVIKEFTKEKFPMFAGAIDDLFDKYGSSNTQDFLD